MRTLLLLLLLVNVTAAEMVLVKDGIPQAEIILQANPTAAAQLGAFELNHHVKLITGAEFPVKGQKSEKFPGQSRDMKFYAFLQFVCGTDSVCFGEFASDDPFALLDVRERDFDKNTVFFPDIGNCKEIFPAFAPAQGLDRFFLENLGEHVGRAGAGEGAFPMACRDQRRCGHDADTVVPGP